MKTTRNLSFAIALVAGVVGCSGGEAPVGKEIAAGAFVNDEPIQVAGASLRESRKCSIDMVNGETSPNATWKVKRDEELVLRGWAFGEDGSSVAKPMFIRLNGAVQTYYAVTSHRFARPDVSETLKLAPTLESGFELRASIAQVEPGAYAIMVMQPLVDGVEGCERTSTLIVN